MNKRILQFDGLRFIAIIIIVLGHVGEGYGRQLEPVFGLAYYHVAVGTCAFFMLSGFLIALTYKQKILDGLSFKKFFTKRFMQMYPMYFLGTTVMILILILFKNFYLLNVKTVLMSELMIACGWITGGTDAVFNGVTWFMSVLLLCYIIYWIIMAVSRKLPDFYPLAIGFMTIWGLVLLEKCWDFPFNYRVNGEGYAGFFAGVLLYEFYDFIKETRVKNILKYICVIVLALLFVLSKTSDLNSISGVEYWSIILIDTAVIYISLTSKLLEKILSTKVFVFLGAISTEICYLHLPVSSMFSYFKYIKGIILFETATEFWIYLLMVFIVAIIVHYTYTKRVNLWKYFENRI